MFSDQQKADLAKPLSRENVKTREQAGRKVSYVESWLVIAEANRIFGFDGWSSETAEIRCVAEKERMIGKTDTKPGYLGWGVSYIAKVRVSVYADGARLAREGVGSGHGIDRDIGQAHESAIKEAESDARKRALMTFGNQFGLALYDKSQANVADEPDEAPEVSTADLEKYDGELQRAAAHGVEQLQLAWKAIPSQAQHILKSALDRRHKPAAIEVDKLKQKAA